MAILKSSSNQEYHSIPQREDLNLDLTKNGGPPQFSDKTHIMAESGKNGNIPQIVHQTYKDNATAQIKKDDADKDVDVYDDMSKEHRCGWGPFSPRMCQRFRDPKWICFWLCWAGAIQGMVVNGFVNVVISNIERRYDLSSTVTGTVASSYDIASVLCLIPVSYFGGLGSKPRYLGIGIFIMGIGSIVFALPQFTSGLYQVDDEGIRMTCDASANDTIGCDVNNLPASLSNYRFVFFLGQLLHGAGAAPLYTLGVTYLDENLPLRSSSFYIGIFYALAIVGPAIGYLAGGAFLDIYVDTYRIDPSSLTITPNSPRWVGAWWIGFLISGALAFLVAFPMAGFPKLLPGSEKYKLEREKEVYSKKDKRHEYKDKENSPDSTNEETALSYKQIIKSVKVLLFNPTFMCLNLAAACEGNLLSGIATFMPKFIEAQFGLPASTAAQYVGYAAIPAGGGGTFLGGYLVKRFDLHVRGIIRLCLGVTAACLGLGLVFIVHCDNFPFAGVNTNYGNTAENSTHTSLSLELDAHCNTGCQCSKDVYNPVCGIDGMVYFSPCYAGCAAETRGEQTTYSNCSCVVFDRNATAPQYEAIEGKCTANCAYLPLFLPICAILIMLTFIASMPALSATLRSIPTEQRSFGLGIQWIIARCLGSIPGPIMFGKLIDITCDLWQVRCEEQGSCFSYDNKQMSHNVLAIILCVKFLSTFFFFLALILYKVPKSEDENSNSKFDKNPLSDGFKDESPPPPTPIGLKSITDRKRLSNPSIHTAVTMLSDSIPTTPASPNGRHNDWSHL
ncbi:solute carrier organic anion transporter family member 4A1-like [Mya arenaria]|uniref:solute carrier organic anion transporter family member 4A1-like n=1 Tax=Mya arenaria TaxID=6604 RepID=UPI0022E6EB64|nr:solute carrier organic anion transporter family member 4A1-like [Mya arenaria]XP_052791204.1 solute carrier organic anion transporter family member 4A1-like [Mya arenaria]XP_052791205.1 solute carrier organic anion transporter family member 4A1-like [Mya arenaria]XP_052791206.1 solute carrier organic anion transporter family member 4A1-like [Mya arenaria]